jgi:transglutaminase/protease-like cytokinesis protein 3
MHLPRTEIQQRLDADFDAMFAVALPPITPAAFAG